MTLSTAVVAAMLVALAVPGAARAEVSDTLWTLLRGGGQAIMIRHGVTDAGVGDPPGFRAGDCATQRNLNDAGRAEARRVGAALQARGVPIGDVLSSEGCRCLETARLAFGRAEPWAPLNSYFPRINTEEKSTPAVRARIASAPPGTNLVLVTHNINIRAVAGVNSAPAEMVVLTPDGGGFRVAGRIRPEELP